MSDDTPIQRTIKIGRASVGLIGLDVALNTVMLDDAISEDEAVERLFAAVSRQNYIPEASIAEYRNALRREYRRRKGLETRAERELVIRVLGPGCVSCNRLTAMLIETLAGLNLAADLESVHDLDEIWRYGVLQTPALVINNKVKCAGRMPTPAQIEQWVREETAD